MKFPDHKAHDLKTIGGAMKRPVDSNYIGEIVLGMALVAVVCAAWHALAGGVW
jgi:hypothetical protein